MLFTLGCCIISVSQVPQSTAIEVTFNLVGEPDYVHMGQFLQGGENGCFVSLFLFTESLCVAKPYKIKLIFQLILVDWVL